MKKHLDDIISEMNGQNETQSDGMALGNQEAEREELIAKRKALIAAIGPKEAAVRKFGRWWMRAGIVCVVTGLSAILLILYYESEHGNYPFIHGNDWIPFVEGFALSIAMFAASFLHSCRARGWIAYLAPPVTLFLIIGTDIYLRYLEYPESSRIRNEEMLGTSLATCIYFAVTILGFGAFASSVVRLEFPKTSFPIAFGKVISFIILIIAFGSLVFIVYSIFEERLLREFKYMRFDEAALTVFCVFGSLCLIGIQIITLLNSGENPAKVRKTASIAVFLGIIILFSSALLTIALWIHEYRQDDQYYPVTTPTLLGPMVYLIFVGIVLIASGGFTQILAAMTERQWRKRVNLELERLRIEIGPDEPPVKNDGAEEIQSF